MSLASRFAEASVRLDDDDRATTRAHIETLQAAGIVSVAQLVDAIQDASREKDVRLVGVHVVELLRERSAIPAIAHAFEKEQDTGLMWATAKALVRLEAQEAAPTLLRVLKGGSPSWQATAAWTLGWLAVPAAAPLLRVAMMDPELSVDVRAHAVEAVGVMQARDAVADLVELLSSESPELRYWAAYSLGQIGDAVSIPALERVAASDTAVLFHERSVAEEALEALESIREKQRDQT